MKELSDAVSAIKGTDINLVLEEGSKPSVEAVKRAVQALLTNHSDFSERHDKTVMPSIQVELANSSDLFELKDKTVTPLSQLILLNPEHFPNAFDLILKLIEQAFSSDAAKQDKWPSIKQCLEKVMASRKKTDAVDAGLNQLIQKIGAVSPDTVKENAITWLQYSLELSLKHQEKISEGRHALIKYLLSHVEGEIDAQKNYRHEKNDKLSDEEQTFLFSLSRAKGLDKDTLNLFKDKLTNAEQLLEATLEDICFTDEMTDAEALAMRGNLTQLTKGVQIPAVLAESMKYLNIDFIKWLVDEPLIEVSLDTLAVLPGCLILSECESDLIIGPIEYEYQSWLEALLKQKAEAEQQLAEQRQLQKIAEAVALAIQPLQQQVESLTTHVKALERKLAERDEHTAGQSATANFFRAS